MIPLREQPAGGLDPLGIGAPLPDQNVPLLLELVLGGDSGLIRRRRALRRRRHRGNGARRRAQQNRSKPMFTRHVTPESCRRYAAAIVYNLFLSPVSPRVSPAESRLSGVSSVPNVEVTAFKTTVKGNRTVTRHKS